MDEIKMIDTESQFGRGLTYSLGLFLAHEGMQYKYHALKREHPGMFKDWPTTWFNGASDHLYELEIPDFLPSTLKVRLKVLQDKALEWGHGFPKGPEQATEDDITWCLDETRNLLVEIDRHLGVKVVKGAYE